MVSDDGFWCFLPLVFETLLLWLSEVRSVVVSIAESTSNFHEERS